MFLFPLNVCFHFFFLCSATFYSNSECCRTGHCFHFTSLSFFSFNSEYHLTGCFLSPLSFYSDSESTSIFILWICFFALIILLVIISKFYSLSTNPIHCQQVLNIERDDSYVYSKAWRWFAELGHQSANPSCGERLILQIVIGQYM